MKTFVAFIGLEMTVESDTAANAIAAARSVLSENCDALSDMGIESTDTYAARAVDSLPQTFDLMQVVFTAELTGTGKDAIQLPRAAFYDLERALQSIDYKFEMATFTGAHEVLTVSLVFDPSDLPVDFCVGETFALIAPALVFGETPDCAPATKTR